MNFKNNCFEQTVFRFLKKQINPRSPILLALSGGPDSLLLFHLLTQFSKLHPIQVGIAHVDHGWRTESANEASQLETLAKTFSLPFHLKTLDPSTLKGNLEAACREERLRFFSLLCAEHGYQSIILGHHADDQAETVLKRMLEGASFLSWTALQPISKLRGMTIWRPLLPFSKKSILDWLEENQIAAFNDATNSDLKFLRARLRKQIIPELSHHFGKEVSNNLCWLAQESKELKEFLDISLQPYLDKMERGPLGLLLDLSEVTIQSPFALRYLLKQLGEKGGCVIPRQILRTASQLIVERKSNRLFTFGKNNLYIDRGRLFLTTKLPKILNTEAPLTLGSSSYGDWEVNVEESEMALCFASGWRHVWKGLVEITLPSDIYRLGPVDVKADYRGKSSLDNWWTNKKVPAFLRYAVPLIWKEDTVCHEFLAESKAIAEERIGKCLRIQLRIKMSN